MFHVPLAPNADPEVKLEFEALARLQRAFHRLRDCFDSLLASRQSAQQPITNSVFEFFVKFQRHITVRA